MNAAKQEGMDRAGELPVERRAAERRTAPVAAALPANWRDVLNAELAAQEKHYGQVAAVAAAGCKMHAGEADCTEGVIKGIEYCIEALERECAATPALPAEKVQGLTEDEQTALLCKIEDYMNITDRLSQTHPDSTKVEDEIYAMVNGFIVSRLAASGGVPAPALPVVPEGLHTAFEIVKRLHGTTRADISTDYYSSMKQVFQFVESALAAAPELPEGNQQPQMGESK